jgi:hypothetical protein
MRKLAVFLLLLPVSNIVLNAQTSITPAGAPATAGSTAPASATKDVPPPNYVKKDAPARVPRLQSAPVIDGVLNDEVWRNAAVFGDFLQVQPGDNLPPSSQCEVMMGYDQKNLYIAFNIKQDRNKIRASIARRDNIFDDDYVGVYLDTFDDKRQAYVFFFNPLGIQADGTYSEGRGEDYSVDLVYTSKGVLTEDGFTIEAAIPFKVLRYEAGKDKNWGIHIYRRAKYNNNELDSWMPGDRSRSGSLNKAGQITGLDGIETGRQLEISPSITISEAGRRTRFSFDNNPAGRYVNEGIKADIGLTAKFSITPTITLDFAYNPDFAQVEADAPVTSANQRFPIFYAEKRPFFLERIDMFRSPLNLVNTRAIVDPDVAAKLTGRSGKNTFGILYASDNAPGNYSKDERESLRVCENLRLTQPTRVCSTSRYIDQNADIGVLRFKRDIGKESNIGFFSTTYNFTDRHNHTAGTDGRIRFDKKTVFEFQVVGTNSRRPFYDADEDKNVYRTGNGVGYSAWLERAGRNLYMNFLASGTSPDYRADVGFTNRYDTNYLGSFIQYKTDPNSKKAIIQKRVQNATNIRYDWKGRSQYTMSDSQFMLSLHKQTYIGTNFQYGYERVFEHEFGPRRSAIRPGAFFGADPERSSRFKAVQVFVETTPTKKLHLFWFMDNTWGLMDYDFGAGPDFPRASLAAQKFGQNAAYDPGPGHQLLMESSIRFQPTTALQTQLNFNKIKLRRDDTGLIAFDDNIISSRTTYQFSRFTFLRVRMDYSTLNKHFRPQIVGGWTPSPGTAFYVGYSDDLSYNSYNPYNGRYEPGLQKNGRTFFIKASYLFKRNF